MSSSRNERAPRACHALWLCLFPALAWGLPEDREQEFVIDFSRSETFLDRGLTLFYGTPAQPAVATQGSLRIEGQEIRVERDGEELLMITAFGNPARFQQQPAADQAVVHASGRSIVFDNRARFLTVDDEATLSQEGTGSLSGQHIEYELDAGKFSADNGNGEGQVQMRIPPSRIEQPEP